LPISAVDSITPAFHHTTQQLVKPFRLSQWTRLAFVGFLAGELGSGGCNVPSSFHLPQQTGNSRQFLDAGFPSIDPTLLAGLIAVLIVTGLVFGLLFMYVSSVMRFTLFDSVIEKNCSIRRGWRRRQGEGWRYFLWQLGYTLATLFGAVVLLGIPAAFAFALEWFQEPKQHLLGWILGGIVVFFLMAIFFIAAAVIHVLAKDFVVPQMALENIGVIEGWRRLLPMMRAERGGYAGYVGMKIVLAVVAGIAVGIVSVILAVLVAVPTIVLGIVAVITGKTAGLTWDVFTITAAVVVGGILLAIFLYVVSLISVPVIVFFPAYSIYFFAARYRPLGLLLYPPPPEPVMAQPSAPPEEPPPLPPIPVPSI
jgi:MFS family permease